MALPDLSALAAGMTSSVPFAATLKIEYLELSAADDGGVRVVVGLPDGRRLHNHVGGPHAGALFTLGETAC